MDLWLNKQYVPNMKEWHTWALWTEKGYPILHKACAVYPALETGLAKKPKTEDWELSPE